MLKTRLHQDSFTSTFRHTNYRHLRIWCISVVCRYILLCSIAGPGQPSLLHSVRGTIKAPYRTPFIGGFSKLLPWFVAPSHDSGAPGHHVHLFWFSRSRSCWINPISSHGEGHKVLCVHHQPCQQGQDLQQWIREESFASTPRNSSSWIQLQSLC